MATRNFLMENYAKPKGFLGNLVGESMSSDNYHINCWAVETLDVQEEDNILEVGFGPGIALYQMAKKVQYGYIAGVDYSELMLSKAKKRNLASVQSGKIDLRLANVNQLPDFEIAFDKIITINNFMYWEEQIEALRNLRLMLKPNGIMNIVFQRCCEDCVRNGKHNEEINWFVHCLQQAGFVNINVDVKEICKLIEPSKVRKFAQKFRGRNYHEEHEHVAGISITASNPSIEEIIGDYINRQKPFARSNRLKIA